MGHYSTTKAIINKIRPGTFPAQGYAGFGHAGLGSGVSLSTNMMLGLALGAVGVVLYCKHQAKSSRAA